jgi:hypothetical protein
MQEETNSASRPRYEGCRLCCENHCGDRGYSQTFPVFTPAGQTAFDRNIPSYGRIGDSADAKAHPEEHIGRRRAQPPALGNDTYRTCNPMGMPRAVLYPDPVEFIVLPDRMLQHFQWGYGLRTIWMDGRRLPAAIDVDIPRWWGHAVGRWEGNTLVVDSTGYDERTWIDHFGYPHSDEMVLQERYTRINYDTIELTMTITDPKYYAKPWVGETKRMHLLPRDFIKSSGWTGLLEDLMPAPTVRSKSSSPIGAICANDFALGRRSCARPSLRHRSPRCRVSPSSNEPYMAGGASTPTSR